jgi:Ca-activated chloride channel family protein
MFLTTSTGSSPAGSFKKLFTLMLGLCLAFISRAEANRLTPLFQTDEGLRLELPQNGNLRVENLRGGVIADLWDESYVSVSAITDSGRQNRSPAIVQRTDSLVSVRVPRGATNAVRINLELKIPARAHVAIVTGEDSVEVRGLPAALLVQTASGEIRVELPDAASADVLAESKTGTISSSFAAAIVDQTRRPQVQARLGTGGKNVRLFSQAGNITLAGAGEDASQATSTSRRQVTLADKREPLEPVDVAKPAQRPELIGAGKNTAGAGTPAPPATGPEEVSEGDVIRVDTELVSVNVSVVDRGTNRGVNNLTKNDFRLYENSVEQQIVHFDSAAAPFNLVLLVDLSGSTTKVVDLIKSAALHFVDAARPFDRIGVITFAGAQVVVSPLTTDREALRQRINAIERPQGSTRLYDSLAFAMEEVVREAKDSRRNAIVVMSDGLDSVLPNVTGEGSKVSYEEVIGREKEFDGVVYSIWVDTQSYEPLSPKDIQQETFDLAHDRMKEFADAGGGAFYECETLQDLAGAYDRVVGDLGTVYTLSYRPTNKLRDGAWRTIRVNVNRLNAVARGKRGYYAK